MAGSGVITNPLAKMCPENETHSEHVWSEGQSEWFCFGGPFIDIQQEIKKQRYEREDP